MSSNRSFSGASTRRSHLRSHLVEPLTQRSLLNHSPSVSFHPAVHTLITPPRREFEPDNYIRNDGTFIPEYISREVVPPPDYKCEPISGNRNTIYSAPDTVIKETTLANEEYVPITEMCHDDLLLKAIFTHLYQKSKSVVRSFVHRYFDTYNESTLIGTENLIHVLNLYQQEQRRINPAAVFDPIPPADVFLEQMRQNHRETIKLLFEKIQSIVSQSESIDDAIEKWQQMWFSINGAEICNIVDIPVNVLKLIFDILYSNKQNDEFVRSFINNYFEINEDYEECEECDSGEILEIDKNIIRQKILNQLFLQINRILSIGESSEHAHILGQDLLRMIIEIQSIDIAGMQREMIELVFKEGQFLKDHDPLKLAEKLYNVHFNYNKFQEDIDTGIKYNRRRKVNMTQDPKPWERVYPGQHPDVRRYIPGVGVVGPEISQDEQRIRMLAWWQANKRPIRVINQPKHRKNETKRQKKRRNQTAKRQNYDGGKRRKYTQFIRRH